MYGLITELLLLVFFLLVFACLDVLLGHFSYFYMEHYIFDFDAIFVLPYVYHFYPFIFSFMCTLDYCFTFCNIKKNEGKGLYNKTK